MFISKGDACCGCMACVQSCPKNVLGIYHDKLGFSYPQILKPDECVNCDLCNNVCPIGKLTPQSLNVGDVLCAYNSDNKQRYNSSSGGVFTLLCEDIINSGGVCYGAAFTENFQVKHRRIASIEDICLIRGSKYVESDVSGVFLEVKEDLDEGISVLFSGTPCQVHGLTSFLNRNYSNLIKVDLFCYGIPSPNIWEEWKKYISNGRGIQSVNFRDKTYGWDNYSLAVTFDDGSNYLGNKQKDLYISTFSKGAYIRKSCYQCNFKAFPRSGDITLGDFQELKKIFPDEKAKNGWSMIKANTEKGYNLLERIKDELVFHAVPAETMDAAHPNIALPSKVHKNRMQLEEEFGEYSIEILLKKLARMPIEQRIKIRVKSVLNKMRLYRG